MLVFFLILQTFGFSAFANTIMMNQKPLRFTHKGKTYRVPENQRFTVSCSNENCSFTVKGLKIYAPRNVFVDPNTQPSRLTVSSRGSGFSNNGTYNWLDTMNFSDQNSEVAGSDFFNSFGPRAENPQRMFASRFTQCYRERAEFYTQRAGCKNSNRKCKAIKSPYVSTNYCYRYVKLILQDCGASKNYLPGAWATNSGQYLSKAGFTKLSSFNVEDAPIGSIIVYSNTCLDSHPAGHIEIKTAQNSFVSDFKSSIPISQATRCRQVKGIYFK